MRVSQFNFHNTKVPFFPVGVQLYCAKIVEKSVEIAFHLQTARARIYTYIAQLKSQQKCKQSFANFLLRMKSLFNVCIVRVLY